MKPHPYQIVTKRSNGTVDVSTPNTETSKTQQQYKEDCDINKIIRKFLTTGTFQALTSRQGQYADFSGITDFHDMCNKVQYASNAFASLPSNIRSRFKNDPGLLLQFLQDPKNHDEALTLGLLNPKETNTPNTNANSNANTNTPPLTKNSKTKTTTIVEDL